MKESLFAIVDLETTGGRANRDKITEIGIVLHDGRQIIDTFTTLVNPECMIPYGITELTGITQEMVADAPKFYEVAKEVVQRTEGAVFVAHNVRFDYTFLREEFRRLGFSYSRKTLCTVRLSRQVFPGLPSYSLGNLIRHFNIPTRDRHRALEDALATADLFQRILDKQNGQEALLHLVNMGIKETLLPKNWDVDKIHQLPEACGVYYFQDAQGDVVYVGKSINIRKRVAEHFAQPNSKSNLLQQQVSDVSFELTGSELVALLLESFEIKRLQPPINRAQRTVAFPYLIHHYVDDAGYICLEAGSFPKKMRQSLQVLAEFPGKHNANGKLQSLLETYALCAKKCGLEKGPGPCFHFHIKKCKGVCVGAEPVASYNERARQAMEAIENQLRDSFFILDAGRTETEKAVILVENGEYQGFGFVDESETPGSFGALRDAVRPYPHNPEIIRIIRRHLHAKNGFKILPF